MVKAHLYFTLSLILANMSLFFNGWAQHQDWLSNEITGSRVLEIVEKNHGIYAVVSNGAQFSFDSLNDFQLSVFEIDFPDPGEPSFAISENVSIEFPENYATIAVGFVEESQLWLLVQSTVINEGFQKYRVALFDDSFMLIAEQTIDTLGYPIPFNIATFNGKTIILGSIIGPPRDELFYFEYLHENLFELNNIQITQSEPNPMFWITSLDVDDANGNLLTFYFNGLAVLDSTLYQVKTFDHTSDISTHHHGTLLDAEGYYYSHGCLRQPEGLRWLVL